MSHRMCVPQWLSLACIRYGLLQANPRWNSYWVRYPDGREAAIFGYFR